MVVRNDSLKMGREGVEPSRCLHRRILSPLRLPIVGSACKGSQRQIDMPALHVKVRITKVRCVSIAAWPLIFNGTRVLRTKWAASRPTQIHPDFPEKRIYAVNAAFISENPLEERM